MDMKQIAKDFLERVASGNIREIFELCVSDHFCHHNPWFKGDADSLIAAMEENALENPDKTLEVKRTVHEGDLVVVHSYVKQNPEDKGVALIHIFRFEGEKIAELWDVGMEVPDNIVNENGVF